MRFPGHENTPIDRETGLPEVGRRKVVSDFVRVLIQSKTYVNNKRLRIPFLKSCIKFQETVETFNEISLEK